MIETESPRFSMRLRIDEFSETSPHVKISVFMGPVGYTRAKLGELTFRKEEWKWLQENLKLDWIEFEI